MSASTLSFLLADGLNAFDDVDADPVVAVPDDAAAPTPSIDVTVCAEEIEVVKASTEAANAEVALVDAATAFAQADAQADAQTKLVIETAAVVGSMESFQGSVMTKVDAQALQTSVVYATRGQYEAARVVGSLEAFGGEVSVEDALNAGLEGLGDFLKEARGKLASITANLRAKMSGFLKDAFTNFDKVAKRAEAIERMAKNTSGESNSSSLQLPLDTAWHLIKDGKLSSNLAKEIPELSKFAAAIFKDSPNELAADRKKFIELVSPLATVELEDAQKIAKKVTEWKVPKPAFAKTKLQNSARTFDVYRSDVMLGDQAIFVSVPIDQSSPNDSLGTRLDRVADQMWVVDVDLKEVAKKPAKLDLAVDTLKPAEIVKIAEEVSAIMADIKLYSKSWSAWEDSNNELDRLMQVVHTVTWTGDEATYQGSTEFGVMTSNLNLRLADAIWYINSAYGYLSVYPTLKLASRIILTLNRILEVCERSLATYNDNNLK